MIGEAYLKKREKAGFEKGATERITESLEKHLERELTKAELRQVRKQAEREAEDYIDRKYGTGRDAGISIGLERGIEIGRREARGRTARDQSRVARERGQVARVVRGQPRTPERRGAPALHARLGRRAAMIAEKYLQKRYQEGRPAAPRTLRRATPKNEGLAPYRHSAPRHSVPRPPSFRPPVPRHSGPRAGTH